MDSGGVEWLATEVCQSFRKRADEKKNVEDSWSPALQVKIPTCCCASTRPDKCKLRHMKQDGGMEAFVCS